MNETSSPQKIIVKDWIFRVKYPPNMNEDTRIVLLLHGHLGNENVMWILTKPLPDDYVLLSPRAPIKMGKKQFSWHKVSPNWPKINDYQNTISRLIGSINEWREQNHLLTDQLDVIGFSQGAVMAYAFSILYPRIINRVAALAGFIPDDWKDHPQGLALNGKHFYVANGLKDEVVPIEKARQTVNWLREQGVQVTFCEADIGHKLSVECFKGLGKFFSFD